MQVYVRSDGCIRLDPRVTCDGFERNVPLRVQSHAHTDHMKDFERSKGLQDIIMTQGTFDLLVAEMNADIPHRSNIHVLPEDGVYRELFDTKLALFPSGHLVGGSMVAVQCSDGQVNMYTSDFSWPLKLLPDHVDILVVDATYGDPALIRKYSQAEVIDAFVSVVRDELRNGDVVFTGVRGRLHAAAQILHDRFKLPCLFTTHAMRSLGVFQKHRGFVLDAHHFASEDGAKILSGRTPCFIFAESRDRLEIDQIAPKRRVYLSPYMIPAEKPVAVYDDIIRVALTDHADFCGTIELIKAIAPKYLIADNSRGGNADRLAEFVRRELQIPASAECVPTSRAWGLG